MSKQRSRRTFLRLGSGLVASTGLAGCLFGSPAVSDGRLLVDNPRNETQTIHVRVVRDPQADGESVADGLYRVPSGRVLAFDGVLEGGNQYAVHARLPDSPPVDPLETFVDACDADDPSEQTTVRIRAARDSVAMVSYGCDRTYNRRQDAEYLEASEYRVEDGTATAA